MFGCILGFSLCVRTLKRVVRRPILVTEVSIVLMLLCCPQEIHKTEIQKYMERIYSSMFLIRYRNERGSKADSLLLL